MPALGGADHKVLIETMQRINAAVANPWFHFAFFGALVFPLLAAALHLNEHGRAVLPWIAGAAILYGATVFITVRYHLPLNDQLAAAGDPGRIADAAAVRARFEGPWVRWNVARAVTCVAALACLAWALVRHGAARAASSA